MLFVFCRSVIRTFPGESAEGLKSVPLIASCPFRRAFKRQCTEDGSWLEGACEPVTCDSPPPVFHGSYHCTNGFRFGSICRLNCSDPAGKSAIHATGGSAHTVRLLHGPCKQVCPYLSSLSILDLCFCLFLLMCKKTLSFFSLLCVCTVFFYSPLGSVWFYMYCNQYEYN